LTSTDEGVQRVCLEFSHACPYDVFKVAAWGSSTGPSQGVGQDANRPAGAESLVTTVSSTAITPSPGQSTACRISSTPVEDVDLDDFESAPAPANPPATSLCGLGSAPERRSAVMIALDWLVPATLCLSMALAIICITYVVLSDPALLDPLLSSLRGE
jgi:hypothetical protein